VRYRCDHCGVLLDRRCGLEIRDTLESVAHILLIAPQLLAVTGSMHGRQRGGLLLSAVSKQLTLQLAHVQHGSQLCILIALRV